MRKLRYLNIYVKNIKTRSAPIFYFALIFYQRLSFHIHSSPFIKYERTTNRNLWGDTENI